MAGKNKTEVEKLTSLDLWKEFSRLWVVEKLKNHRENVNGTIFCFSQESQISRSYMYQLSCRLVYKTTGSYR